MSGGPAIPINVARAAAARHNGLMFPGFRTIAVCLAVATVGASADALAADTGGLDQVARAERYLNGISSLEADFLQVAPDGSVTGGRIYMARPGGRIRVEYTPPSQTLIVGRDGWIVLYDGVLDQDSRWPLGSTPLGALMQDRIDLTKDVEAGDIEARAGVVRMTLRSRKSPETGALVLLFTDDPYELRQWQVVDAQNLVTTVTLSDLRLNRDLDPELFVYEFEELSFEGDD